MIFEWQNMKLFTKYPNDLRITLVRIWLVRIKLSFAMGGFTSIYILAQPPHVDRFADQDLSLLREVVLTTTALYR